MVKIYKKDRLVIIEGVGEFTPGSLNFTITNEIVNIISNGLKKSIFNAHWSMIRREDESSFTTGVELNTYLTETLTLIENDFLAYYILNRDT